MQPHGHCFDALFRIISGICKKTRKYSARNTVEELNHNTKLVCMHEFVIHEKKPDSMHELVPTECEDFRRCGFIEMTLVEILKGIGNLQIHEPSE